MSVQSIVVKLDIAVQKLYLCKRERHEAAGNPKGWQEQPATAQPLKDTGQHERHTYTKKLLNVEKHTHKLLTIKKKKGKKTMSVFYKLYQDNRETSANKGKWYARAVHTGTVTIDDLADEMQANCTVKRADIVAVLSELVETMQKHLQMSHRVKLDRLGTFKIGMHTSPADTVKDFTASGNVKSVHVLFQPETKIDKNKTRTRALLTGCKVQELPKNAVSDALDDAEAV